jgi:hypothetical protein
MTENFDNHTIRLLQEMRVEAAARDEKTQAQIGILAQALNGVKAELIRMREDIHAITIAVDHHSTRLDRIEQHLGLDAQKH